MSDADRTELVWRRPRFLRGLRGSRREPVLRCDSGVDTLEPPLVERERDDELLLEREIGVNADAEDGTEKSLSERTTLLEREIGVDKIGFETGADKIGCDAGTAEDATILRLASWRNIASVLPASTGGSDTGTGGFDAGTAEDAAIRLASWRNISSLCMVSCIIRSIWTRGSLARSVMLITWSFLEIVVVRTWVQK